MPIENLSRLSMTMLGQPLARDGFAAVSSKFADQDTVTLPPKLRSEVAQLLSDVRSTIPDDFDFTLVFKSGCIGLSVDYEDGNTGSTAMNAFFTSRKSMLQKSRDFDWETTRAELIKRGGIFEHMVNEAADRPVDIPSSAEAALYWADELKEVFDTIAQAKENLPPFILVIARNDFGVEVDDHETRGRVVYTMADVMTTGCDILAVVEGGRHWTFEEIEAAKLEAVEELGPISRAKAERRIRL